MVSTPFQYVIAKGGVNLILPLSCLKLHPPQLWLQFGGMIVISALDKMEEVGVKRVRTEPPFTQNCYFVIGVF